MFSIHVGGYSISLELRNGVGLDLEFCDARPIWVHNSLTDEGEYMSFEGVIILLPLLVFSVGKPYQEES